MRAYLILAVVILALAASLGWVLAKGNPWKARAVTAEQGQALATETGKITERTLTKETVIYKQAEASAHAIETLPSGGDSLPDDVRSMWLSGLRDGPSATDDQPAGSPAG